MKIKQALTMLAAPIVLAASPAAAAKFTFGLTGSYQTTFDLDTAWLRPPADVTSTSFTVENVLGSFGGAQGSANAITFFTSAESGGFTLDLDGADFRGFFGPQLFGGTTGMPTFAPGTFTLSSDLDASSAFLTISAAAVPEPATWAMMLIGFGAIGFVIRRRTFNGVDVATV